MADRCAGGAPARSPWSVPGMDGVRSFDQYLPPQFGQVLVVAVAGDRYVVLVEPIVSRLVAADEQDRRAPRVEGVEDAERSAPASWRET